jgi:hypothetical protein
MARGTSSQCGTRKTPDAPGRPHNGLLRVLPAARLNHRGSHQRRRGVRALAGARTARLGPTPCGPHLGPRRLGGLPAASRRPSRRGGRAAHRTASGRCARPADQSGGCAPPRAVRRARSATGHASPRPAPTTAGCVRPPCLIRSPRRYLPRRGCRTLLVRSPGRHRPTRNNPSVGPRRRPADCPNRRPPGQRGSPDCGTCTTCADRTPSTTDTATRRRPWSPSRPPASP